LSEPQLKIESAFYVDCHDLTKFALMHLEGFGAEWDALHSEECHNGSIHRCRVTRGEIIEDDDDQDFLRWLMGFGDFYETLPNVGPNCQHMLQWLCNLGVIPEGTYVVDLWW